jgi:hypothetical protein
MVAWRASRRALGEGDGADARWFRENGGRPSGRLRRTVDDVVIKITVLAG